MILPQSHRRPTSETQDGRRSDLRSLGLVVGRTEPVRPQEAGTWRVEAEGKEDRSDVRVRASWKVRFLDIRPLDDPHIFPCDAQSFAGGPVTLNPTSYTRNPKQPRVTNHL